MKSNCVLEHFGKFAIRFVFKFYVFIVFQITSFCVPKNFEKRTSPLRASRKVMQVRLLFHSIRSPEDLQKLIQPEPEIQPEALVRLEIFGNRSLFSGMFR